MKYNKLLFLISKYLITAFLIVSVSEIANHFNVTRMTIYGWFDGTWIPTIEHKEKIIEVLEGGGGLDASQQEVE